jgi:hypothetical protein
MILNHLGKAGILLFGLLILVVSLARAGLTIAQENTEEIKKNEVWFVMTDKFGNRESKSYKLPEVRVLPSSMFYGFKRIRDYLWLSFSSGMDKPKIAILMADKKVTEYQKLVDEGNNQLAVEAGIEAVDKLKYVDELISTINPQNDQTREIHQQVLRGGLAYKEIFVHEKANFELVEGGYSNLISTIDEWNKEQEDRRFEWDR